MTMTRKHAARFVSSLTFFCASAAAQIVPSEVFGTVTDPSGASVASASVKLISDAQGFVHITESTEEGYSLSNLIPGSYRLEVAKGGFKPFSRTGVLAITAKRVRLDIQLEVGTAVESVTVSGDASLLDSGNQEIGQTVDNRRVIQLPLNGRSYLELATLAPNALPVATGTRQGTGFVLGGSRFNSNNLTVDGIDNNTIFFNRDVVRPSVDSIAEFRVITNSPSAEYGRNMGGVLTVVTKSGSNEFHGTLFEFHRNNQLNARNAFSSQPSPFFVRNQYGASLGGPVLKNRIMFFGNFEKLKQRESAVANLNVPTLVQRQGIFSASTIFDPATTRRDPADPSRFVRDPFPGNRIPESSMDSVGRTIAQEAWPVPNVTASTHRTQVPRNFDENQWNVRGDIRASDRSQFALRYTTYDTFSAANDGFPAAYSGAASPVNIGHNALASHTFTFSPRLINDARVGFNRFTVDQKPVNFGTDPAGAIGLHGTNPSPEFSSFPSIQTGYSEFGSGSNFVISAETTYHATDTLTWHAGRHTLKTGVDFRYLQANVFGSFVPFGQLRFGSIFSSNPSQANTGDVIADLLLGYPQSIQLNVQFSPLYNRQVLFGSFVQDEWRISRKLTLSLGIRYELFTPVMDKYDRQSNPNMANPLGEFRLAVNDGKIPDHVINEINQLPIPPAERARLFQPGDSRGLTRTNKLDFSPRFGAAYQLDPNTVIRAGLGTFRSLTGGGTFVRLGFNPPNFIETFFIVPDAVTPIARLQTGVPSFQQGSGRIDGLSPRRLFEDDNRTQLALQTNLSVQRQLANNLMVELGYIGSFGRNLTIFLLENQIRNKTDYGKGQAARPVPLFGNVWGWGSGGVSGYHAAIARVEKRFGDGLALLGSYTWSKSLDNAPGDFAVGNLGISTAPIDSFDLSREYGLSAFDTRHRLVISSIYELPFGRGKRWVNHSRLTDLVFGGWDISSIGSWQSGLPVDARTQTTRTFSFNNQNRPNRIADGNLDSDQRSVDRWFDTGAYTNPADFLLGSSGRNTVTAPGIFNLDATIGKKFAWSESRYVQFRTEFFNLTNTTNFNAPVNFLGNPNFGKILGSRSARQIQLALRIHF
jgi:hypothetical protein